MTVTDHRPGGWQGVLAMALIAWFPVLEAAVTVRDDAGQSLTLAAPARRIISLAPHATELLYAAGAGKYVVGVSAYSNYPEPVLALPRISNGLRLDLERLLALQPDLVVGWRSGNARSDLDAIAGFGIPVFIAEPQRLTDLPVTLVNLGRLAGTEDEALRAANAFRGGIARLRTQNRDKPVVRVLLQVSIQPLMTLSHRHMAHDVLTLCGGRNIFAASELVAPDISLESVLLEDPDVILFSDSLGDVASLQKWWQERMDLRAVRERRLYAIPADLLLRQTPRLLQGAERVCSALDQARTRH